MVTANLLVYVWQGRISICNLTADAACHTSFTSYSDARAAPDGLVNFVAQKNQVALVLNVMWSSKTLVVITVWLI